MTGITSNDSNDKKARRGSHGALADKRQDPREAQMEGQLQTSVAARVADNGILEKVSNGEASTEDVVDGMAARLARDRRNPTYEWAAEPCGDEVERQSGWTQAQVEEIRGREHERDRQRQKAHLADEHELDRAQKSRADVKESFQGGIDYSHGVPDDREEPSRRGADPRESLSQEELAEVNKSADRLADHFEHETAMTRPSYARLLAKQVAEGASPASAMMSLKEDVQRFPTVQQPLKSIKPYSQWQTTVEGEITQLWEPKDLSQRQVGLFSDGTRAPVKLVIWRNSGDKPTLHVGDSVRLTKVKVNVYQGEPTLAVTGDTEVWRTEPNPDGAAPRTKMMTDNHEYPSWDRDSRDHKWIDDVDMDRAIQITKQSLRKAREDLREERTQLNM